MLETEALWTSDDPLPVLTIGEREEAQRALAAYRAAPKGSPASYIAKQFGMLANVLPTARLGNKEADARLAAYEQALADLDTDVLRTAVAKAIETRRFFPTVAELREIAHGLPAPSRMVCAYRLRRLIEAADQAKAAGRMSAGDQVTVEQVAAIKAEFGISELPVELEEHLARAA